MNTEQCHHCKGQGFIDGYKCHVCKGEKFLERHDTKQRYQSASSQGGKVDWQSHEIELLTALYPSRDVTFGEICERLSRTKGSVAGKANEKGE